MSDKWKTQNQIDEASQLAECYVPETTESCDYYCQEEAGGIGTPDGMPFCNTTGKQSLAIDFGGHAELRDGSIKKPIQLTGLQKLIGTKFRYLAVAKEDGTIQRVRPPTDDCSYRIKATKEGFQFVKDVTENEFDPNTLYSGDKPDFVLGGKIIDNSCGESVMRLAIYDISDLLDILEVSNCDL